MIFWLLFGTSLAFEPDCYRESSTLYGVTAGSTASDLDILSTDETLTIQHRLAGIRTCWDSAITGIQLMLTDPDRESAIILNPFGQLTGICETFFIPPGEYITTLQMAHSLDAITSISFIATNGEYRIYGHTDKRSQVSKFTFSPEHPWIGLHGSYQTRPNSLGAIAM